MTFFYSLVLTRFNLRSQNKNTYQRKNVSRTPARNFRYAYKKKKTKIQNKSLQYIPCFD